MPDHVVNIGEVLVHGIVFDPKNGERLRDIDLNAIPATVSHLFELLAQRDIRYALIGDMAMLVYFDGRNTQCIELLISKDDLKRLPEISVVESTGHVAVGVFSGLKVEFVFAPPLLVRRFVREFTTIKHFVCGDLPCATVEGLVLTQLYTLPEMYRREAYSRVDNTQMNLALLLDNFQPPVQPLLEELSNHMLPSDIAELESIVARIQSDIIESRRRFGRSQ